MPESFGARLRQRREEQGIALVTIAEGTKIKLSLLDGLERDDVSHWPPGIFRRAYIRAYAQASGLDPDVAVREFLDAHPEPADAVTTDAIASVVDGARMNGTPPTRLRYIVGSAIDSLSRLRRSPGGEDGVAGDGSPVNAPVPVEPAFRAAAHRAHDLSRIARASEAVLESTSALAPAGYEPDLPPAASPSPEPGPVDGTNVPAADSRPVNDTTSFDPDWLAVAQLCTEFGRVENTSQVQRLLGEAATILDATGLVVWVWDAPAGGLRPALAHGYSDKVLAQLRAVGRDEDNATAAAFRSARTCAIEGSDHVSGALVVPLLTAEGCAGVLAIELPNGREQTASVRAAATIFAALLAQLAGSSAAAEVPPQADATVLDVSGFATPVPRTNVRG